MVGILTEDVLLALEALAVGTAGAAGPDRQYAGLKQHCILCTDAARALYRTPYVLEHTLGPRSNLALYRAKNQYSNRRCTRQHNCAQRAHFTESHAKIAVKRLQCTSTTRRKRVRRSRPKRKIYSLGGLSDSLPRRTGEAAAVLLRHKRRNGPGRTNDTAPRRLRRQFNQTRSCLARTETVSSLFTSGAAHTSAHHLHSSTNDDMCDCIYAAYHDVHAEMNHDYGVPPGALRPGGPWPDGIG